MPEHIEPALPVERVDKLTERDIERATETMERAFAVDPVVTAYFQQGDGTLARIWWEARARTCAGRGQVYRIGDWAGVMLVIPAENSPEALPRTIQDDAKAEFARLLETRGGAKGTEGLRRVDEFFDIWAAEDAKLESSGFDMKSADCIMVLAVHPDHQRKGLGAKLVRSYLRDRLVSLVTFTDVDVAFYEKLGFTQATTFGFDGETSTIMLWTPPRA